MEEKNLFTKSQKTLFTIIAVIVLVVILIIGVLYSQNMNLRKQNDAYKTSEEQNNTSEKSTIQYTQDSEGNFIPLP